MSLIGNGLKESSLRIRNGADKSPPKTLLTLYQCKGLNIARAGAPSPLSTLSGRQTSS